MVNCRENFCGYDIIANGAGQAAAALLGAGCFSVGDPLPGGVSRCSKRLSAQSFIANGADQAAAALLGAGDFSIGDPFSLIVPLCREVLSYDRSITNGADLMTAAILCAGGFSVDDPLLGSVSARRNGLGFLFTARTNPFLTSGGCAGRCQRNAPLSKRMLVEAG